MKKFIILFIASVAAATAIQAQSNKSKTVTKTTSTKAATKTTAAVPVMKNLLDSFSYAAGFNVATNMQAQGIIKLNTKMMQRGVEDVFNKSTPLLATEACNTAMTRQLDIFNAQKTAAEKAVGEAYLADNKKKPGVITLASGLQYEVIKNGDANGVSPKIIDTVVVNYIGKLINGEEFDNSVKRGEPAAFPVGGVIKGWIEILQLMKPGDHWKVFIPSDLAYGPAGAGQAIPPNSALIFEIMLEDIKPAVAK